MISLTSDFTATPVQPTSAIAPKELIGNVNFTQLLGGIQASEGATQEGHSAPLADDPSVGKAANHQAAEFVVEAQVTMQPSGKELPQSGTALPQNRTSQQKDSTGVGWVNAFNTQNAAPLAFSGSQADAGLGAGPVISDASSPSDPGVGLETASQESLMPLPINGPIVGPVTGSVQDASRGGAPLVGASEPFPKEGLGQSDAMEKIGLKSGGAQAGGKAFAASSFTGTIAPDMVPLESENTKVSAPAATPAKPLPDEKAPSTALVEPMRGAVPQTPNPGSGVLPIAAGAEHSGQTRATAQSVAGARDISSDANTSQTPASTRVEQTPPTSKTAEPKSSNREAAEQEPAGQSVAQADGSVARVALTPAVQSPVQIPVQAAASARSDLQGKRFGVGSDLRAQNDLSVSRTASQESGLSQRAIAPPMPQAFPNLNDGEADPDLPRTAPPAPAPQSTSQATNQSPVDVANSPQTPTSGLQVNAGPISTPSITPLPTGDTSAAMRLGPQLEDAIEQLAETRSAVQASKPELTLRHQEFGAITMRLETTGGDLRATLSARDPGFVPAIQAALTERGVVASGETTSRNNDQSGSNSQSQSNSQSNTSAGSHGHNHGHNHSGGWNSGAAYGSSTGSGQGTSQPYTGQTEGRDEESGLDAGARRTGRGDGSDQEGEIFA